MWSLLHHMKSPVCLNQLTDRVKTPRPGSSQRSSLHLVVKKTHNVATPACPLLVLSHYRSALPYFCHPTPNSVYLCLCWCSEMRAGLSRIVAPFLRSSAPPVSCPSLRTHKRGCFFFFSPPERRLSSSRGSEKGIC